MELFNFLITTYIVLIVARLFLPLGGEIMFNPLLRLIIKLTEPVLQLLRRRVPPTRTGFDLSPLVAAIILVIGRGFVLGMYEGLGAGGALLRSGLTFINLVYIVLGILLLGVLFVSLGSSFSYSRFTQIILAVTDPVIHPLRRFTGYRERGLDWAPVLGLVLLVGIRAAIMLGVLKIVGTPAVAIDIRGALAQSVYLLVDTLITFLMVVMIARVIVSWINVPAHNPLVQAVVFYSDPILIPIRRIMPAGNVGLDFSPMFGIILLMVIRYVVRQVV